MSTDVGFIFSLCAGVLIGLQTFNWLLDERREELEEENERINQQLKRQMEKICREQRYKSELEKARRTKQKMTDSIDVTSNFIAPGSEPKDGTLLDYHGKLFAYKSGIGWTALETKSEKFSKKEIIKDLWYGTGGK